MYTNIDAALAAVQRAEWLANITGKPWAVFVAVGGFRVRPAHKSLSFPVEVCWP